MGLLELLVIKTVPPLKAEKWHLRLSGALCLVAVSTASGTAP